MISNFFSLVLSWLGAFQQSEFAVALSGFLLFYFLWEVLIHKVFGKREFHVW